MASSSAEVASFLAVSTLDLISVILVSESLIFSVTEVFFEVVVLMEVLMELISVVTEESSLL